MAVRDLTLDEMNRTIFDMEQRGEFPKRFTLTPRRVAWDLAEVEQWMEGCRSEGRKANVPGM